MTALVSRTGRHRQRYDEGSRLVAGCIPYRFRQETRHGETQMLMEVLMVTPNRGKGLLFPKGGWENDETREEAACREALEEAGVKGTIEFYLGSWDFSSKRHKKDCNLGASRKSYMYALRVAEQLDFWPEKDVRQRKWVTVEEAKVSCQREWMRLALEKCVDILESSDSEISQDYSDSLSAEETTSQNSKSVYSSSDFSDDEHSSMSCEEFSQDDSTEGSVSSSSDD
eukprot:TRINITY_DN24020_c0_g2_i1.p1 TRINITY_DN24020_c0_g2~~TRINITY_DN24020_c0_g2_i1.p1  ORF type:complete len:227 (-),score=37.61 TRINITY_DN24020_c0_g2_i1:470-1150(-)